MPELSADAKKELAEAIRIVREDKQYSMLRDIHTRSASGTGSTPPPNNPPNDPGITPPPANPTQPPPEPQAKKDAYWGELLS